MKEIIKSAPVVNAFVRCALPSLPSIFVPSLSNASFYRFLPVAGLYILVPLQGLHTTHLNHNKNSSFLMSRELIYDKYFSFWTLYFLFQILIKKTFFFPPPPHLSRDSGSICYEFKPKYITVCRTVSPLAISTISRLGNAPFRYVSQVYASFISSVSQEHSV